MDSLSTLYNQDEEKGSVVQGVYVWARDRYIPPLTPYPYPDAPDHLEYNDPSSKMWAFCISQAHKHDTAMTERWKADMDGILIYVRTDRIIFDSPIHLSKPVCRRVCSPRQLLHSSSKATKPSSLILATYPQDFGRLQSNLLQCLMEPPYPLRRPLTHFGPHVMLSA